MAEIIKRAKNVFLVRVFLGRDPTTGKILYHNKTIHGPMKDAQQYAREFQVKVDKGEYVAPSALTLNEYLDQWLKHKEQGKIAANTHEHYTENLNRYIRPSLGGFRLCELHPLDIQNVYNELHTRLSARTVRYAHSVLSSALKQAVRWRMLSSNPAAFVDLPKKERKEMQAITSVDAPRFLEAAKADRYFALFALVLETGLRPSECFALRRSDINFERGDVIVQRKLIWKRDGTYYIGEPKTARSRRNVPLSPQLLDILKHHLSRQAEERLKAGPAYDDKSFLFASKLGLPLREHNVIVRHFKPILERAKLPASIRLYDLRHSCATVLLETGTHPKVVADRLGHSSVMLTLDTYSHVTPTLQQNASLKIANAIFGGQSHSSHTKGKR
jgi:integrase